VALGKSDVCGCSSNPLGNRPSCIKSLLGMVSLAHFIPSNSLILLLSAFFYIFSLCSHYFDPHFIPSAPTLFYSPLLYSILLYLFFSFIIRELPFLSLCLCLHYSFLFFPLSSSFIILFCYLLIPTLLLRYLPISAFRCFSSFSVLLPLIPNVAI